MLSLALLGLWAFALSLTLWGTLYALKRLRRIDSAPYPLPPISVMKPLKGVDDGLEANLISYFELKYPQFELLFSVADAQDPAIPLVQGLQERYPAVASRFFIGEERVGPNPKVNNLVRSYRHCRYEWCLISDSNTRIEPDGLHQMARYFGPGVGVVTGVVAGEGATTMGGRLEAIYLNTFFARWTFLASWFGKPFVIGKAMCFRRSTAERFGGIRNLSHYIAEDNMFGQAVLRLGMRIAIMHRPVRQHIGRYAFRSFWSRHVRWGRIRKAQAPLTLVAEPLATSLWSGLLGAWGYSRLFGDGGLWFLLAHMGVWALCDGLLIYRLEITMSLKDLGAWWLREIIAIPHLIHMAGGDTVTWRGKRLKILPGGLLVDPQFREIEIVSVKRKAGQGDDGIPLGSGDQQSPDRRRKPFQRLVELGGPRSR